MTDPSPRPAERPVARSRVALELLGILAVLAALVAVVDPRGEFPLNDDWDFAKAAWAFAETGEFHFTGYTAASVRLQALWGALWTRLFGASYEVLRVSTIVASLAMLLVLDRLLARFGARRAVRLLAVAALLVHPIWLWSTFTFMTHVPAIFMSLLAIGAFAEALRRDDLRMTAAGAAATAGSYFIRQTGVVNSIAMLGMLLLFRERISTRWRAHALIAAAPTALFGILFVATDWLGGSDGELQRHYKFLWEETSGPIVLAKMFANYTIFNAMEAGLFFLPFSLAALVSLVRRDRGSRIILGSVAAVFLARAAYLVAIGLPMPFFSKILRSDVFAANVFVNWGLGPLTLTDTWHAGMAYPFALPWSGRVLLTFAAAVLGAAAVAWCFDLLRRGDPRREPKSLVVRFLLLHLLVANASIALSYMYSDRYGLDAHWPIVILFALTLPISARSARGAVAAVLLVGLVSTAAVSEYLEWNRARWRAIEWLGARGVAPSEIDGGVEHRMHTGARVGEPRSRGRSRAEAAWVVTFNPLPGMREVRRFPYERWFGVTEGRILLLRKEGSAPEPPPG